MDKGKRWVGIAAIVVVTVIALIVGIVIKNNSKPKEDAVIEIAGYEDLGIKEATKILDDKDNVTGYRVVVESTGFTKDEPIVLAVTFDASGEKVTELEVVSHKETEGIGSKILEESFLNQFKGVSLPVFIETAQSAMEQFIVASTNINAPLNNVDVANIVLHDGTYTVKAAEAYNGYTSFVTLTVSGGKVTEVLWDNLNAEGVSKRFLADTGAYVMTEAGPTWTEQANLLAEYVITNQNATIALDADGKTDVVATVSISINDFVDEVNQCLILAAAGSREYAGEALNDGVYAVKASEPHNGYTSEVTLTVSGGKVTEVIWDNLNAEGVSKRLLADTGAYVMTEAGPTWTEQANLLANYVITNQNASIAFGEDGKTDAIATVSITIDEFVNEVRQCLILASYSGANTAPVDTNESRGELQNGIYVERATEEDKGYFSQVVLTVENGVISSVVWDCFNSDNVGKAILSETGGYVMTEDGLTWAAQAEKLAAYVVDKQGVSGLTIDESGKTDVIAGVSISINSFINQVEACLTRADAAKVSKPATGLTDGTYFVKAEEAHNGYVSQVTLVVAGGRIDSLLWDCLDADGNTKRVLSQTGGYVMTESGATWADQATALATYVIENQGLNGLVMDESGKIDTIATVSIAIGEFISQTEECLRQAGSDVKTEKAEPTPTKAPETQQAAGTKIDGISGATYSVNAVVAGVNNAYEFIQAVR